MTGADRDRLRDRLHRLRRDALDRLAAELPAIDAGLLALVADAGAALEAIEDEAS